MERSHQVQRFAFLLLLFIAVPALETCTADVTGAPCESDNNCPTDQVCGQDYTCQYGIRQGGDDIAGGRDVGGLDGGRHDAGIPDASHIDAGLDASLDATYDGGRDTGSSDGGDAGDVDLDDVGDIGEVDGGGDGGGDGGFDTGTDGGTVECTVNTDCPSGVCCASKCYSGECCADGDCKELGKPTCAADHACTGVCFEGKTDCGGGFFCCGGRCRLGNCCNNADCATHPNAPLCINYNCSKSCTSDGDCLPGKCCKAGPAAGSCYEGACCDDGQCTKPDTCGGGGVKNTCGCAPASTIEFCKTMSSTCGPTTGKDNCAADRTENCGTCPNPSGDCKIECLNHLCSPKSQASFKCDAGDVYWFDSCGTKEALKTDCVSPQVCHNNDCCTPIDDATLCQRAGYTCGPLTATENCGQTRSVPSCGTCTTCASECVQGACKPKHNVSSKCDPATGDLYWYDSCDNRDTIKEDCVPPAICTSNACCTPSVKSTLCQGKCGTLYAGCGVSYDCGGCDNGQTCDANHNCSCPSAVWCGAKCCPSDQVCNPNTTQCCTKVKQTDACQGKCGQVSDGCGSTYTCNGCPNGNYDCVNNVCGCKYVTCNGTCCASGQNCVALVCL